MNKIFLNKILPAAAIICSCFFFSCENDRRIIEELSKPKAMVEEGKNIESYLSQGNIVKAKLWAPYMLRYVSDTVYVEFPKTLHVNFFDSVGNLDSHLDARYGKYFENQNKVYLRDSVLVYNTTGDTLRSPDLWWDQNTQTIYTDKNVWVKKAGTLLIGKNGMNAKQDLSEIHLKQTTGLVEVPDSLRAQ